MRSNEIENAFNVLQGFLIEPIANPTHEDPSKRFVIEVQNGEVERDWAYGSCFTEAFLKMSEKYDLRLKPTCEVYNTKHPVVQAGNPSDTNGAHLSECFVTPFKHENISLIIFKDSQGKKYIGEGSQNLGNSRTHFHSDFYCTRALAFDRETLDKHLGVVVMASEGLTHFDEWDKQSNNLKYVDGVKY